VHHDIDDNKNLLSRGQSIEKGIDEKSATFLPLQPGEFSLHHGNTAHASTPNNADERRIGIAIRYVATQVRPVARNDSAIVVRGHDDYGHFLSETAPINDFDSNAIAEHEKMMKLRQMVLLDK
jgi:hypothetical protein